MKCKNTTSSGKRNCKNTTSTGVSQLNVRLDGSHAAKKQRNSGTITKQ